MLCQFTAWTRHDHRHHAACIQYIRIGIELLPKAQGTQAAEFCSGLDSAGITRRLSDFRHEKKVVKPLERCNLSAQDLTKTGFGPTNGPLGFCRPSFRGVVGSGNGRGRSLDLRPCFPSYCVTWRPNPKL